ncbi:hypothetical protein D5086_016902 [Populus alba]|uniref:Uncharacterized protein n=1 Tax=Populus alba TaxID=43335 RepID=A0ACC4BVZ7_POPAL
MWEMEAAARASNSSGTVEVVLDNTDDTENLAIPKVVLKDKALCPASSSNDQRVQKIRITRIFQLIGRDQSSLKKKDDKHINCTMMIMWWVPQERMMNCVLLSPQHLRSRPPADVHFLFPGVVPHQNASLRRSVNLLTSSSHGKHIMKWNRVHAKMAASEIAAAIQVRL